MASNEVEAGPTLPAAANFKSEPLRLRVAAVLRDAILDGDLRPGTPLTETVLAGQLAVSRAPVREAMRILAKEGLIETRPYRGSLVRTITRRDVEEVYGLRHLHESFAVERIVRRHATADLARLEEVCTRMRGHAEQGDMRAVSVEDDRFHRVLIELADHELLLTIWIQLSHRVRQIMSLRNLQIEDPHRVVANHVAIVDALRAKDLEAALGRVAKHVEEGSELVVEGWVDAS